MCRGLKESVVAFIAIGLSLGVQGSEENSRDLPWYENAVQDVITFDSEASEATQVVDLFTSGETSAAAGSNVAHTGTFYFNGEPTTAQKLAEQLKGTDSVCLLGYDNGTTRGLVTQLVDIMEVIGSAEIDDEFINLNLECTGRQTAGCAIVMIAHDGTLSFDGKNVELSEIPGLLPDDCPVGIHSDSRQPPPPLSKILAVVKAVGKHRIDHLFIPDRARQVQVSARIFQVNGEGVENDLSCPKLTTQPGYAAVMRVVQNNSGYDHFDPANDPYDQEDLGNLGIRFSVNPALIGDYIRLSGAAVLVQQDDSRQESFKQRDVPIYSYAVSKTVCPFSCVIPQDKEYVEIPVASVDGIKTICRISAILVDERGMPRARRETERVSSREPEPVMDLAQE